MGFVGPTTPSGPAGGSLEGTYPNPTLAANSVGTLQLAALSVTEPKYASSSISNIKLGLPVIPAEPAEGGVANGATSPDKHMVAVLSGNGVLTKFVVKHSFNTRAVNVIVQNESAKLPGKPAVFAKAPGASVEEYNWIPLNENEIEVTFGKLLAAKELAFVTVS